MVNSVVLSLYCTLESPGAFFKIKIPGPHPEIFSFNLTRLGPRHQVFFVFFFLTFQGDLMCSKG